MKGVHILGLGDIVLAHVNAVGVLGDVHGNVVAVLFHKRPGRAALFRNIHLQGLAVLVGSLLLHRVVVAPGDAVDQVVLGGGLAGLLPGGFDLVRGDIVHPDQHVAAGGRLVRVQYLHLRAEGIAVGGAIHLHIVDALDARLKEAAGQRMAVLVFQNGALRLAEGGRERRAFVRLEVDADLVARGDQGAVRVGDADVGLHRLARVDHEGVGVRVPEQLRVRLLLRVLAAGLPAHGGALLGDGHLHVAGPLGVALLVGIDEGTVLAAGQRVQLRVTEDLRAVGARVEQGRGPLERGLAVHLLQVAGIGEGIVVDGGHGAGILDGQLLKRLGQVQGAVLHALHRIAVHGRRNGIALQAVRHIHQRGFAVHDLVQRAELVGAIGPRRQVVQRPGQVHARRGGQRQGGIGFEHQHLRAAVDQVGQGGLGEVVHRGGDGHREVGVAGEAANRAVGRLPAQLLQAPAVGEDIAVGRRGSRYGDVHLFELRAAVEGIIPEGGQRIRQRNLLQAGAVCEGIRAAKLLQVGGQGDVLQLGAVGKGPLGNARQAIGQPGLHEVRAVGIGIAAQARHAVGHVEAREGAAAVESIGADVRQRVGQFHICQGRAAAEDIAANRLQSWGQFNGGQGRTAVEYAFVERRQAAGDVRLVEGGAALEGIAAQAGDAVGHQGLRQLAAATEGIAADGRQLVPGGEGHVRQGGVVIEGSAADALQGLGQRQRLHLVQVVERVIPDGLKALGQRQLLDVAAVIEGIVADGRQRGGEIHLRQARAAGERAVADLHKPLPQGELLQAGAAIEGVVRNLAGLALELHVFQLGILVEQALVDGGDALADDGPGQVGAVGQRGRAQLGDGVGDLHVHEAVAALEGAGPHLLKRLGQANDARFGAASQTGQRSALGERGRADLLQAVGQRRGLQRAAAVEGGIADLLQALGQPDLRQARAGPEHVVRQRGQRGILHVHILDARAVPEHVGAHRLQGRGQLHLAQRRAAPVGLAAQALHAVGEVRLLQRRAALERAVTDAQQAVRQLQLLQRRAAVEGVLADGVQADGHGYRLQGRAVLEQVVGNVLQVLRKGRLRQGRAPREQAPRQLGHHVVTGEGGGLQALAVGEGALADGLQRAGEGHVGDGGAAVKGALADLFGAVQPDLLQRRAALERAVADLGHPVQVDLLQVGTVGEGAASHLRDALRQGDAGHAGQAGLACEVVRDAGHAVLKDDGGDFRLAIRPGHARAEIQGRLVADGQHALVVHGPGRLPVVVSGAQRGGHAHGREAVRLEGHRAVRADGDIVDDDDLVLMGDVHHEHVIAGVRRVRKGHGGAHLVHVAQGDVEPEQVGLCLALRLLQLPVDLIPGPAVQVGLALRHGQLGARGQHHFLGKHHADLAVVGDQLVARDHALPRLGIAQQDIKRFGARGHAQRHRVKAGPGGDHIAKKGIRAPDLHRVGVGGGHRSQFALHDEPRAGQQAGEEHALLLFKGVCIGDLALFFGRCFLGFLALIGGRFLLDGLALVGGRFLLDGLALVDRRFLLDGLALIGGRFLLDGLALVGGRFLFDGPVLVGRRFLFGCLSLIDGLRFLRFRWRFLVQGRLVRLCGRFLRPGFGRGSLRVAGFLRVLSRGMGVDQLHCDHVVVGDDGQIHLGKGAQGRDLKVRLRLHHLDLAPVACGVQDLAHAGDVFGVQAQVIQDLAQGHDLPIAHLEGQLPALLRLLVGFIPVLHGQIHLFPGIRLRDVRGVLLRFVPVCHLDLHRHFALVRPGLLRRFPGGFGLFRRRFFLRVRLLVAGVRVHVFFAGQGAGFVVAIRDVLVILMAAVRHARVGHGAEVKRRTGQEYDNGAQHRQGALQRPAPSASFHPALNKTVLHRRPPLICPGDLVLGCRWQPNLYCHAIMAIYYQINNTGAHLLMEECALFPMNARRCRCCKRGHSERLMVYYGHSIILYHSFLCISISHTIK